MTSVIVTGGASGIGAAIVRSADDAGWRVGVLDTDVDAASRLVAGLADAVVLGASVTDPDAVEAALDEFGVPDVVVNNAGIVRFDSLVELDLGDWRAALDVNLTGTFVVGRAAARRMLEGSGGSIVNLSSMNGVAAGVGSGSYGPSKAAVIRLTEQMALEWAPSIRVNAVAPGLVDAGMSAPIYRDPDLRRARESKVPLGRLATAPEIADAVLWLAGEDARYVTGQTLVVDGGVTMSMLTHLPR